MAGLIALSGHRKELTDDTHLVGSEATADICVRAEMGIAPQHYRVIRSENGWLVEPLAGPGTTAINGTPISAPTPINHGDQIAAGQLVLTADLAPETAPPPLPEAAPAPQAGALSQVPPIAQIDPAAPAASPPPPSEAGMQIGSPATPSQTTASPSPAAAFVKSKVFMIAALAVLLLGGGAAAAWKFGVFGNSGDSTDSPAVATAEPEPAPPTKRPDEIPLSEEDLTSVRDAKNLASVHASSMAAGTEAFKNIGDAETAARKLIEGVYGGKDAGFDTVLFQISLDAEALEGALQHIRWDDKKKMLTYDASESTLIRSEMKSKRRTEQAKMNARKLASVYSTGLSAGAKELSKVANLDAAIEMISKGVYGGKAMGFDNTLFNVPGLDKEQKQAAARHLVWNDETKSLLFKDKAGE